MEKREKLENLLELSIISVKHDKVIVEGIKTSMLKYGILKGEVQRIFMNQSVTQLDQDTLILFSLEMFNETNIMGISPYMYFTNQEISYAKTKRINEQLNQIKFPLIVPNTMMINRQTYRAFLDIKFVVGLYNSNILEYNYNINKQYKFVKNVEGKMIQTINIDMTEVKAIAEKILENKYKFSKLVLNVMNQNASEINYNYEMQTLTINESQVDIVDGLHEITALSYVIDSKPDIELKIEVEIKHNNLEEIQYYFNQLNIKGGVR